MKKNILVVDPASRSCGWSWWQWGKLVAHGTIACSNDKDPIHKRLLDIFNKFGLVFGQIRFDEVHIEQLNTRTHRFCIWAVGMIYTFFGNTQFVADDVAVTSWKAHYGLAQKDKGDKIRAVFEKHFPNETVKSDDEYEAILMGKYVIERRPKPAKKRRKR